MKRSEPKFRVGQTVVWRHRYHAIKYVLPLHCQGAAQRYTISPVVVGEEGFVSPERGVDVSEQVLRQLTAREQGRVGERSDDLS